MRRRLRGRGGFAGSAALVGLPAAVGAIAGVALQQRLQTRTLTFGFSLVLAAVGIRLLV